MKKYLIFYIFFMVLFCVASQAESVVSVNNLSLIHEHKGWRVLEGSVKPIHFNLLKGDLIVRIDGKNAADTGPMQIACLLNQGYQHYVQLFIERGKERISIDLRQISSSDYSPAVGVPFRHVASGFSSPDWNIKDLDGNIISLDQYKGKWLLIDFMSVWCQSCIEQMPTVLDTARHEKLDLLIVALNDRPLALQRIRHEYKIASPIAALSSLAPLPVAFGVTANMDRGQIPAFVLIAPDGEVAMESIASFDPASFAWSLHSIVSRAQVNEDHAQ